MPGPNPGLVFSLMKKVKDLTARLDLLETKLSNVRDLHDARLTQLETPQLRPVNLTEEKIRAIVEAGPKKTKG